MFRSPEEIIVGVIVLAVFLLVAFPIHEFAHAFAAFRLGDHTARMFGRLTLDPRAHFDPTGGLMLAISILLLGFGFGWAKPTPVNPMNLRGGRWGEAIVSAAGPLSNLILAIGAAIPLRYIFATGIEVGLIENVLALFILINLLLMVFNLIPIPPLDGSKVLFAFLEPQTAWRVRPVLEQYGFLILIGAIFLPIFGGSTLIGLVFGSVLEPLYRLLVGL
ncbi:MAG TPA: site-2 protease family protein [Candidatus Deferrimicrobiaceae bacterium]|nr:site-2 protease family protein [Candidatus Deferrimicrobiaceae bacterium]